MANELLIRLVQVKEREKEREREREEKRLVGHIRERERVSCILTPPQRGASYSKDLFGSLLDGHYTYKEYPIDPSTRRCVRDLSLSHTHTYTLSLDLSLSLSHTRSLFPSFTHTHILTLALSLSLFLSLSLPDALRTAISLH